MCLVGSLADQPRKTVEGKRERERGGEKGRKEKKEGRKKKQIRKKAFYSNKIWKCSK